MTFKVELTPAAESDLGQIADYVTQHHSLAQATYVVDHLQTITMALASFPERGDHPPELLALGIKDYRQVFFQPYRIIYRMVGKTVYVYLIADGRRDMQRLLSERLLK